MPAIVIEKTVAEPFAERAQMTNHIGTAATVEQREDSVKTAEKQTAEKQTAHLSAPDRDALPTPYFTLSASRCRSTKSTTATAMASAAGRGPRLVRVTPQSRERRDERDNDVLSVWPFPLVRLSSSPALFQPGPKVSQPFRDRVPLAGSVDMALAKAV